MSPSSPEEHTQPEADAPVPDAAGRSDLDQVLHELEEWKDLAHRRSAEIANMQRRAAQERADAELRAAERMIH